MHFGRTYLRALLPQLYQKVSIMLCVNCMLVRLGFWTRETSLSEINVPYVVCCLETVGHVLLRGFHNLNSVTGYAWSSLSFANCMLYYVSWRISEETGKNRNRPSVLLTNRLLFRIQFENITNFSFFVNLRWGNQLLGQYLYERTKFVMKTENIKVKYGGCHPRRAFK